MTEPPTDAAAYATANSLTVEECNEAEAAFAQMASESGGWFPFDAKTYSFSSDPGWPVCEAFFLTNCYSDDFTWSIGRDDGRLRICAHSGWRQEVEDIAEAVRLICDMTKPAALAA